jgi:hypothetical protein
MILGRRRGLSKSRMSGRLTQMRVIEALASHRHLPQLDELEVYLL